MNRVIKANAGGALAPVIQKEGVPALVYQTQKKNLCDDGILEWKEPRNCFQLLCRIIAGQQLAGSAETCDNYGEQCDPP